MKKIDDYKPIRVWKKTHYLLRLIAAHYQESIVELIDRLANEEIQRMKDSGSITNFPGQERQQEK